VQDGHSTRDHHEAEADEVGAAHAAVHVGTSGWSYQDWVGPVYPAPSRRRPGTWLEQYARRFATVEVNSTYYRLPSAAVVERWRRFARGRAGFRFTLKAPQALTHDALARGEVGPARAQLDRFLSVVASPLASADALGPVLLQLAPWHRFDPSDHGPLARFLDDLPTSEVTFVVEPRHLSWYRGGALGPAAAGLLKDRGVSCAWIDGPHLPAATPLTAPCVYLRLHGRNDDLWHLPGAGALPRGGGRDDRRFGGRLNRYDYLYGDGDLKQWALRLEQALQGDRGLKDVYVIFNNHPGGSSVRNAETMAGMLGVPMPGHAAGGLGPFGIVR